MAIVPQPSLPCVTLPVDQGDQGALDAEAMAMLKEAGKTKPKWQKY